MLLFIMSLFIFYQTENIVLFTLSDMLDWVEFQMKLLSQTHYLFFFFLQADTPVLTRDSVAPSSFGHPGDLLSAGILSFEILTNLSVYILVTCSSHSLLPPSIKKLNLWLTAPKGATPVNQTSATDWQIPFPPSIQSLIGWIPQYSLIFYFLL